ncbi:MAG: sulfatase-like hydrolase/transferase [Solirubrobacteraceae bacterium]|jgi:arylsulfatase A-like enzyme
MTDKKRPQEPPVGHASGRVDRRSFIAGGLRVGGAITAASIGVEGLVDAESATARRRKPGPYRRSRQPNILVIMVDQLRTPRWFGPGSHGAALPPNIAALANSGVSFARHYTASNDCTPARATMLTGLHTHQTGCMITGASTLEPGFPTWGTMLREHGYTAYWYGKWHLTHGDRHWNERTGPPGLALYGFDGGTYPSPNGAPGQGWRVDPKIAEQFDQWYGEAAGDGPWCTTVSFVNPHDIAWWWRWTARSVHEASAPSRVRALPPNFETPAQLAARRKPSLQMSLQLTSAESFGEVPFSGDGYEAAWLPFLDLYVQLQLEVDRHVGAVMATLARRPEVAKNTVVVFTSDHGEYGASHGLRGKGAGMYEEAIRVPLIVSDRTGRLGAVPNTVRQQLTSSVDLAPLLLTLAAGSDSWRHNARYAHLATRADLVRMLRDPAAPGRRYALHATDEVLTEFALLPHDAQAPLHVRGIVTPTAKYATYSNWRPNTLEPQARGEEAELYDYTNRAGYQEIDNLAGRSRLEERLAAQLQEAAREELHAPLPSALVEAQRRGLSGYQALAVQARRGSELHRLRAVDRIVSQIEHNLP